MANKNINFSKLPIGLIGFVIAQTVGIIWWAAKIDHKVSSYEKHIEEIPKITEKINAITHEIDQLEEKVYGK
jgi:hypothetical protein